MKVCLETMGCQMNVLDSELAASLLRSAGMEMTGDAHSADVILYNTCSVRSHAEDKVHSRLGWACRRKTDGRKIVIGVLGCMAQRLGEGLIKQHAGVDIVCGPGQLGRLVRMIQTVSSGVGPQIALDPPRGGGKVDGAARSLDLRRDPHRRHLPARTGAHRPGQAFVRIMHGCDKFCTYCIVPYVRGPERSRPPEEIIEEVRRLVDAGVTQVTLLGQTVNSYCSGGTGPLGTSPLGTGPLGTGPLGTGLADLLERLNAVGGIRRIRFVTSYPGDFDRAILQAMRDLPKVCEYLHIPAQSGSDRILRAMGRRYSRAEYDDLIDAARETVPGVGIAGDFIVGFPSETEDDFAASADLVRRSGYKNSYIFKYSPRPGTAAAKRLTDDVSEQVKRRRNRELLAVQNKVSLAGNRAMIGQTVEVLVEGPSPRADKQSRKGGTVKLERSGNLAVAGDITANLHSVPLDRATLRKQLVGRTRTDHIVVFDGAENLAGQYVNVEIIDAAALTLFGELNG